jgi:hypothetical protein
VKKCIICDSKDLQVYLDLGNIELPIPHNRLNTLEQFELKLNYCENCNHIQISNYVDYSFQNYMYNEKKAFYEYMLNKIEKDLNITNRSSYSVFSDSEMFNKIIKFETYRTAPLYNIIILENLHNEKNPKQYLLNLKKSLSLDSRIYLIENINSISFDDITHNRASFFNINSLKILFNNVGLNILDIQQHRNSHIFILTKSSTSFILKNINSVKISPLNIEEKISELKHVLAQQKSTIGFSNTFKMSNFTKVSNIKLKFIASDLYNNQFTAGQNIQITNIEKVRDLKDTSVLVIDWEHYNEIRNRLIKINSSLRFITIFPILFIQDKF